MPGRPGRRRPARLLLAGALLLLAGCQGEKITAYKAAHTEKPLNRILGALIPRGELIWAVKLVGPEQQVKEQETAFQEFVKSLRFSDVKGQPPITWALPGGWKFLAKEPLPMARTTFPMERTTFDVGPKELEMSVMPVMGTVAANVNRWRNQLGLPALPDSVTLAFTQEMPVDGATATLVDLTGTGSGKRAQAPAHAEPPPQPQPGAAAGPLTFKTPPDWKKLPQKGIRFASFEVARDGQHAEVTVIPLGGMAGTLLDNVNRWRNELKLPPIEKAQLKTEVSTLKVAGADASYVDLLGPAKTDGPRLRTLAVSVPQADRVWFFKMMGPAELVGSQKTAFEAFVTSAHFPEGAEK